MKNEGVKTDHMFIHKDKATAINFIIVDRKGTKRILQDPKLRTNIPEPSYLDNKEIEELMNKVAHVHLSATRLETALTVACHSELWEGTGARAPQECRFATPEQVVAKVSVRRSNT